jgi:hypothetical protein
LAKYDVYEKEGAVFRGPAKAGYVNQVRQAGKWVPYQGDRRAPVAFGEKVREESDED